MTISKSKQKRIPNESKTVNEVIAHHERTEFDLLDPKWRDRFKSSANCKSQYDEAPTGSNAELFYVDSSSPTNIYLRRVPLRAMMEMNVWRRVYLLQPWELEDVQVLFLEAVVRTGKFNAPTAPATDFIKTNSLVLDSHKKQTKTASAR